MIRLHIASALVLACALPSPIAAQESTPAASVAAEAVRVPAWPNSTCPVMGKAISTRLFTDTKYGRIYICCKACVKDIQADVESNYRTAYPETTKITNSVCPVTAKPIDSKTAVRVELQGREFSVADAQAAERARADAQATLTKLLDPKLVDVGNATCPTSGEAAAQNVIAVIDGHIVRFASAKAIEEARKDPKKTLARAREIRAEEDRKRAAAQPADANPPAKKGG
jgi:hypothetical protein